MEGSWQQCCHHCYICVCVWGEAGERPGSGEGQKERVMEWEAQRERKSDGVGAERERVIRGGRKRKSDEVARQKVRE